MHSHRVRAEPEEDAVAETEHARVAPQQIEPEGEDRVGEKLTEEVQREIRQMEW